MTTRRTIVDLADEHVEAAAGLRAARHEAQRRIEPGLDPAYEASSAARAELESVRDRVLPFLLGAPLDESWGPNVWISPAGHAVTEPELTRDLYAAAAERWVAEGRTSHYAIVPATDAALVDAWFRLGSGHQHVHAIREVPGQGEDGSSPGVEIRPARREDVDSLAALDLALPQHQILSPVLSRLPLPRSRRAGPSGRTTSTTSGSRRSSQSATGRSSAPRWAARSSLSSTHTSLALPRGAAFLGFAAVFPEKPGGGAGRALGEQALAWAGDAGYAHVVTDWRMTNLTSSRTWPRLGFRPTFYRLFRAIA